MSAPFSSGRNDIRLLTIIDGEEAAHFRLREFENRDGLAMVHSSVLDSLERVRRDLCAAAGEEVWLIITDGLRTQTDLERLAARLGWTDEGGAVSRQSKHLAEFGGSRKGKPKGQQKQASRSGKLSPTARVTTLRCIHDPSTSKRLEPPLICVLKKTNCIIWEFTAPYHATTFQTQTKIATGVFMQSSRRF